MQKKSIQEIEEIYDLELNRIIKEIEKSKSKRVLLQFPDGIKSYATVIASEISEKTSAECLIWLGSCFGACDIPVNVSQIGVDLIIQFGHSAWSFRNEKRVEVV